MTKDDTAQQQQNKKRARRKRSTLAKHRQNEARRHRLNQAEASRTKELMKLKKMNDLKPKSRSERILGIGKRNAQVHVSLFYYSFS